MTTIEADTEIKVQAAAPVDTPRPAPRSKKKAWNTCMKLVRRVHLYSGIFMFPFVLLYGVTGWLFNHPSYFTGDETTTLVASEVAGGKLAQLTAPNLMATEIVAAINKNLSSANDADDAGDAIDAPLVVLTDVREPQYSGFMSFSVRGETETHSVTLDPSTGDGEVRTRPQSTTEREQAAKRKQNNPLHTVRKVQIEHNAVAEAKALLPAALKQLGLDGDKVESGRRSPSLSFSAEVDGVPTIINCNLGSGDILAVREDALPETETKNFLQRLHLSRRYSPHFNIQWFWALLVDGMVLSMVFWGLSGMIMWWQIKRTRLLGGGFFIASIVCTTFLTIGMHDHSAVSSGLRNSRPRQQRSRQQQPAEKKNTKSKSGKPPKAE